MSINRRNFFKVVGVTGLTVIGLKAAGNDSKAADDTEFHGVLYDSFACVGCRNCENTCAEAHNFPLPQDELVAGITRKTSETQRCVINAYSTPNGEAYMRTQCMHCNEPACVAACLTKAMYKTKEGPVIWRENKCMGCRYCMVSCPFDVPKFEYHSANPKIQKCDMCYDRIIEGKIPACVENCGVALFYGTRRELIAEARKRIVENPGVYVDKVYGETVAGGTGCLYLSSVPVNELGMKTDLQNSSYPALTKGFLYSVPSVFVLVPTLLLGISKATKNKPEKNEEDE